MSSSPARASEIQLELSMTARIRALSHTACAELMGRAVPIQLVPGGAMRDHWHMPDHAHARPALAMLLLVVVAAGLLGFLTASKAPRPVAVLSTVQLPQATMGVAVPSLDPPGTAAHGMHSVWIIHNGRWRSVPT
jgi:hypothetical protein